MNLPVANIVIDVGSLVVLIVVLAGILQRVNRGSLNHFFHWSILASSHVIGSKMTPDASEKRKGVARSIISVLFYDVFATRVLGTCSKVKRISHLAVFWGFVFLAISTTLAFFTNPNNTVLPLYNPVKIFGNAGGILVIAGFLGMFYVRSREKLPVWRFTRSDLFLLAILLTVVTGFITQEAIYSTAGSYWVSSTFWIHMILVTFLLATAPFTKFFHALSKPVSLLYEEVDRRSGREPLLPMGTQLTKDSSE
jgi:nitrate reductase gamma subunit